MNSVVDRVGAVPREDGSVEFVLWAPRSPKVELRIVAPEERRVAMEPIERGYHRAVVKGLRAGSRYLYRLSGGEELPDPASRLQPEGVHGPSEVVDFRFPWSDSGWRGPPLDEYVIYELHVGTFTPEGTLDAACARLDELRDLGVTVVELMPLAQFPGARNWGYDGVFPFAVQSSYGGPSDLARLVDACHARGLAVALDVVYNHLGPEGNYFGKFGPYFTDRYRTPWGSAMNFDGPHSDEVRHYFIENALYWVRDLRVDALRLDALHAIYDDSARPFLEELAAAVRSSAEALGRRIYLIAESDLNAPRLIEPPERGGYGLDAQWSDDFHHALHTVVTGERDGYYADFGALSQLEKAYRDSYVYTGEHSAHRARRHGRPAAHCPPRQFVVASQNHDQVGNRMLGERLSGIVSLEELKLVAAATILSPYLPLLFMGEEYGESAPFQYFVSHSDPALVEAVRRGRSEEFASFSWKGEAPDPQAEETFLRSKLRHELKAREPHRSLLALYRELLRLRRSVPALARLDRDGLEITSDEAKRLLWVHRKAGESQAVLALHFGKKEALAASPLGEGTWSKVLDSADRRWAGPGSPTPESLKGGAGGTIPLPPSAALLLAREPRGAGDEGAKPPLDSEAGQA